MAAYQANFKFKAAGKEHEVPELLRGVIKDKDTEKFVHELMEKAYGLPSLKERYQEKAQKLEQITTDFNYVMGNIQEAQQAYRSGDLDTVFDILKIAPEKVLQWAVKQVEYSQMPPEQRQLMEAQRAAELRARELEKQTSFMTQEQMQQQTQYLGEMLNLVLERPDYSQIAQSYDARRGKDGAFRELVIRMGESEFALSGKSISPLEAAKRAVELLGESPQAPQAQVQAPPAQQQATPAVPPKKTLPNLANAGARPGAAPAKPKYKSIDDLKKRHQELLGNNT